MSPGSVRQDVLTSTDGCGPEGTRRHRIAACDLKVRGMGYKDGAEDLRAFRRACEMRKATPLPSLLLRNALAGARAVSDPAGNSKLAASTCEGRRAGRRDPGRSGGGTTRSNTWRSGAPTAARQTLMDRTGGYLHGDDSPHMASHLCFRLIGIGALDRGYARLSARVHLAHHQAHRTNHLVGTRLCHSRSRARYAAATNSTVPSGSSEPGRSPGVA